MTYKEKYCAYTNGKYMTKVHQGNIFGQAWRKFSVSLLGNICKVNSSLQLNKGEIKMNNYPKLKDMTKCDII